MPPLPKVQCPNFFFYYYWGKVMERGKSGSQIWKLLLINSVKSPRKKKLFFGEFCLTSRTFLLLVLLSASVKRFFGSCMRFFSSYLGKGYEQHSISNCAKDLTSFNICLLPVEVKQSFLYICRRFLLNKLFYITSLSFNFSYFHILEKGMKRIQ